MIKVVFIKSGISLKLGYSVGEQVSLPDLQANELYRLGVVDIIQLQKPEPKPKKAGNAKKNSNRTDKRADYFNGGKKLSES